ncbi:MAG: hypothetical protein LUG57_01035, partial [Oscillospiraceae bacterium]|nr:hypothetical protein [Oscillospiraceae bacterium]
MSYLDDEDLLAALEGLDLYIRKLKFPNRSAKAITFPNDDGSYDIYLNTLYSDRDIQEALAHELRHISLGHFYSDAPIAQKEAEADGTPAVNPPPVR